MVVIVIESEHHPEDRDTAFAATMEVALASRAEAACQLYAIARDCENPAITRVTEVWDSVGAHREHMTKPHVATFFKRVKDLRVVKRKIEAYETVRRLDLQLPIEG